MFFWNSLAFLMIQWMLAIWSLVPLSFLKPAWTSGSSQIMYCWSLSWRILSIPLLACEMSAIVWYFEHSLALPFFGIGMKSQSCDYYWVFQIWWHIECSTFTASSFRIWNRSTVCSLLDTSYSWISLFVYFLKTTGQLHWKLLTSGICVFLFHRFHGALCQAWVCRKQLTTI